MNKICLKTCFGNSTIFLCVKFNNVTFHLLNEAYDGDATVKQ